MSDVLTPLQRKKCMASIKNKNTKPELLVRKALHRMGFRFRLHRNDLPGKPDIVLPCPPKKKVIFVHGCFWHMHTCKYGRVKPKTNSQFWEEKRTQNFKRDNKNFSLLRQEGWDVMVFWECWTKDVGRMEEVLLNFLRSTN